MSTTDSTSSSAIVPTDNPALSGTLLTYNSVVLSSFVLFGISALIWVVLSFLQRRTKKCLGCCGGRPGIVFPINFLNPRHRLVYVLACGALASTWFRALNTGDFSDVNKWAVSIVKILFVIFLLSWEIFTTFPLLACVEAPVPVVGYILGAIYTDVLLALRIYVTVDIIQQQDVDGFPDDFVTLLYSKYVVTFLPQLVCIIGVLAWYHYKIIKEIVRICRTNGTWTHAITNQPESQAQIKYVKQLLHQSNLTFFRKHIYTRVRIPFSLLIVCVVDAVIIFQLVVLVVFQIPYWFNLIGSGAKALLNQNSGLEEYSFLKAIPRFFDSLTTITVIAPIVAALIVLAHFLHLLYSVQVQLKEFRTGKKKVLKSQIDWPAMTLSSSLRYAGYQIAAVITAWIVYTVVIFVLLLLVSTLILFSSQLGYYYYQVFILVAWTVFLTVSQIIICKLLFVAKESRSMKTLVINNKRAFCFFSYVMLLYNIATGLMTAVLRVSLSFLSMVLLLPRMDRLLFLRGFERFDTGFGMFNSFMAVENLLQNPVAQVFVMLMQSNIRLSSENFDFAMKMFSEGGKDYTLPSAAARFSTRARNRWFVAYTLIKNPKLRKTHEGGGYSDYSSPVVCENKPLVDEPDTDEPLLVPEKEEFSSHYVKL